MTRFEVQSVGVNSGEDDGDYIDRIVKAIDTEDAAKWAVANYWRDDYGPLPDGMLVKVRKVGGHDGAPWERFSVTGEPDVHWRAERK